MQLEEALLLLVSRMRARERVTWMGVDAGIEMGDELLEALARNGFVAPDAALVLPAAEPAPKYMDGRAPALLAFVGRPRPGFLPPALDLVGRSTTTGTGRHL